MTRTAPLSFAQQRLWFLAQLEPRSPAYNILSATQIEGPLDTAALERSLIEMSRRHETLRTTFAAEDATPVQLIHPSTELKLQQLDFTAVSEEQREKTARRLMHEEAVCPFHLVSGPLLRAKLLRMEPEKHLLLLTIHHIVSDGWSMGVLHHELFTLYGAFSQSHPSPLSELRIQYADFAVWQRQYLQGDLLAEQLDYWRQQLKDLTTLDLPTDRPRPPMQTFTGATHEIHLPLTLVKDLNLLGRKEGATLFMTLFAAFQTLLHRYSGQDDIVVGTPIAGRTRVEVEGLIGFFVNMLVLRTDASGDPTFRELLKRAKKVAIGAYAHQDIPFEKVVEELHPRRDPSRNPLFQVVFALQNTPRPSPPFSGLKVSTNAAYRNIRFDLEAHLTEAEDGLHGVFVYNTMLFEAQTIARMAQHFRTVLEGIAENPDLRLSELPILTPEERHQLLVEWNQTETQYPRDACIHELFETQANATPDALAIAFGNQRLTYRQLNERSNQLAHHLRALGVGPDVLVGVFLERSVEMVEGLLGILKAGGAYLPIDPLYPTDRIAFMLEDAGPPVLLTQSTLAPHLPEHRSKVVCFDIDKASLDCEPDINPPRSSTPENLAYVIYTSGSTGRPKGVMVTHQNVVRLFTQTQRWFHFGPSDVWTLFHSYAFDFSVWEIFGALLYGGRLVIVSYWMTRSPKEFRELLCSQSVTVLNQTPSAFRELIREEARSDVTAESLRLIIFGGEALDFGTLRDWFERYGDQRPQLVNMYGITETTVHVTYRPLRSEDLVVGGSLIGRAIGDLQLYILDPHLQPVPVGVCGEIFVAGEGLARGYLNRPELTAARFIPNPFSNRPGDRLYRTGDLARRLPSGEIEYLGRSDNQVKLRGFRIELQEIEAVLCQHSAVREAVVIAREDVPGEKRLVAYLVASPPKPEARALRELLKKKLPEYMVPAAFVFLEQLPRTPSGKADRKALPASEEELGQYSPGFVEPRTSTEEGLARIWRALLGIRRVGVHDNFFDLGGHSLLGFQMMARIEQRFGKNLSVTVLFQSPTIEQLARILSEERPAQSWSLLIPLQPEGSKLPFFWINGGLTNAFLPAYLGADQPLYGIEHQRLDGRRALYTQVDTIARHYLSEIRTILPDGPYLLGGYCFGAVVAFEMAQQLKGEGEEVALLFMLDPSGYPLEPLGKIKETRLLPLLWSKVQRHLRKLALLGFRKKLDYLLPRVKDQIDMRILHKIKKLTRTAFLAAGITLPQSLRIAYIFDVYGKALRGYMLRPYSGRVTLVKAGEVSYHQRWDWIKAIVGDLEVHEVRAGHLDLQKEPYVRLWAERLKESLDQAHASMRPEEAREFPHVTAEL